MAQPQNYWSNTSSNEAVKRFIQETDKGTVRKEIEKLIAGETIVKEIHQELTYQDMYASIENLWSVLFTTGYLTQTGRKDANTFMLTIPNMEIRNIFLTQIMEYFKKTVSENGEALEGAVIGIFKAEETEFTKDTALMTTTSAKDGSFSFAKVPYGKWIVREIEQPKGFVLDEKAYEVNISKAEQVVEIEIVNEYVHGNIRLTKVDAEYPDNKLTGATFEVYKDTNENGKIDDGDELIGNLEETETGIYEMKELLYGKYIVRETKAPEGFLFDKGEYSVFIEKDETTYSVENKAGVGFINEAMRGTLKIVKTSSDGKVKGFAFRVTGANGYDMTFETDKNGEIVIEGLRIGEYTISEVANNASAAYITPADQNVTIKLDETAVVKMHNELRDTPKTGDNTNMKLWYVLAGLSSVGIAVTSVVAHKKKKKEGNE